mmetsp:Transcript_1935/g.4032  ORF Transcript_1935/g.4032 Transcript_1935/m.4032 type:complete len:101 (-) Transcript_1935:95-397(-)
MLNVKSMTADQIDVNDSLKPREEITAQDIKERTPVKPRIEYHQPAMRRRDEPPQRESASIAVYVESEALMISNVVILYVCDQFRIVVCFVFLFTLCHYST